MNFQPEYPTIFSPKLSTFSKQSVLKYSKTVQWTEFIAHISQFSEMNVLETHEMIQLLENNEPKNSMRATLLAGIGRCQIHEGDLIKGAGTLGYASTLLDATDTDSQAFVITEMASFLAITGQYDLALIMLDRIPNITKSQYLLNLAHYYWLVLKIRKGDLGLVENLKESAFYFRDIHENATLAYHYKNIGNAYRKLTKYSIAEKYYQKALNLSRSQKYTHIESAVMHDIGMLRFHMGRFEDAVDTLDEAFLHADSFYTQSFILLNIGYLYTEKKHWRKAILYLQRSMEIVSKYDLYFLLPSLTFLLGKCQEKLGNPQVSKYYYKKGYHVAMELITHHFPCTGYRKAVIDKYIQVLSENQQTDSSNSQAPDQSFAIEKTLRQIRAIFQGSIFEVLGNQFGKTEEVIRALKIPRRTYFDTRKRIKNDYPGIPQSYCVNFYQENSQLSWVELNQKFDLEICTFLFEKYNYNKTILSQKLGVSYTHTIKLTEGLNKPVHQRQS